MFNSVRAQNILARSDHLDSEAIRQNRGIEAAAESEKISKKERAIADREAAQNKTNDASDTKAKCGFAGALLGVLAAVALLIPAIAIAAPIIAAVGGLVALLGPVLTHGREEEAGELNTRASREDLESTKLESEQSSAASDRAEIQQAKRARLEQALELAREAQRARDEQGVRP